MYSQMTLTIESNISLSVIKYYIYVHTNIGIQYIQIDGVLFKKPQFNSIAGWPYRLHLTVISRPGTTRSISAGYNVAKGEQGVLTSLGEALGGLA